VEIVPLSGVNVSTVIIGLLRLCQLYFLLCTNLCDYKLVFSTLTCT